MQEVSWSHVGEVIFPESYDAPQRDAFYKQCAVLEGVSPIRVTGL